MYQGMDYPGGIHENLIYTAFPQKGPFNGYMRLVILADRVKEVASQLFRADLVFEDGAWWMVAGAFRILCHPAEPIKGVDMDAMHAVVGARITKGLNNSPISESTMLLLPLETEGKAWLDFSVPGYDCAGIGHDIYAPSDRGTTYIHHHHIYS